jgi:hypothetical protein
VQTALFFYFSIPFLTTVMTETFVTVLNFEHRERADILVRTALFFILSTPFLSNFVSIVSVTTVILSQ